MKKSISILVLLALVTVGAFAQVEMSGGSGLLYDYSARNGIDISTPYQSGYIGFRNTSFGVYAFLDFTYLEFDMSFARGSLTWVEEFGYTATDNAGSMTQIGFSALVKYPLDLGFITFYPLFGLNYNRATSLSLSYWAFSAAGNVSASDLSQFGIQFGAGGDYDLSDTMYIRGQFLLQLRFASKLQRDMVDLLTSTSNINMTTNTTLGFGPRIKVGVGYRF